MPALAFAAAAAAATALLWLRARAPSLSASNVPLWEDNDPSWRPLPPLPASTTCDVCVVGLGGSGLTAVHALLSGGRALTVIGLDAGDAGCGAAGRNGGLLLAGSAQFYHDAVALLGREAALATYHETMAELEELFASLPPHIAARTGSLRIAADAAELADCQAQLAAMAADSLPVQAYSGPEGQGLLFPTDGVMQPLRRVRWLAQSALSRGAALHGSSPVRSIEAGAAGAAVEVRLASGLCVRARRVIVAVDGRLEALLPELAPRVRTARLQMCATAASQAPPAAAIGEGAGARAAAATAPPPLLPPSRPVYTRWGYDYWQRRQDGSIAVGGFRDACEAEEWTHEATPTPGIQARLQALLQGALQCRQPIVRAWAASVSYTHLHAPDFGAPVSEEVRPGVFAIGAYSGTGNVLGAVHAKRAAAWALRAWEGGGGSRGEATVFGISAL